jgi:hypothetical protein
MLIDQGCTLEADKEIANITVPRLLSIRDSIVFFGIEID